MLLTLLLIFASMKVDIFLIFPSKISTNYYIEAVLIKRVEINLISPKPVINISLKLMEEVPQHLTLKITPLNPQIFGRSKTQIFLELVLSQMRPMMDCHSLKWKVLFLIKHQKSLRLISLITIWRSMVTIKMSMYL